MVNQIKSPRAESSVIEEDSQKIVKIRHTCAHILAMAVQTLFPETKVAIGPWTETGFYYDFDRPTPFTPEDLEKIAAEMGRIIGKNLPIIREVLERSEITAEIECLNQPDKKLILERIPPDKTITHYFISSPDAGGAIENPR